MEPESKYCAALDKVRMISTDDQEATLKKNPKISRTVARIISQVLHPAPTKAILNCDVTIDTPPTWGDGTGVHWSQFVGTNAKPILGSMRNKERLAHWI